MDSAGVGGTNILTGDDKILTAVVWTFAFTFAGLGSSGCIRTPAVGFLTGECDLPDVVQDLRIVAAGEFSLSAVLWYLTSVRGRTRTGDPKFVCFRGDSGTAV